MAAREDMVKKITQAPREFDTTSYVPREPQPDYREWFIDQVAIGLIVRGRGQTDAWKVANAAWDQRQAYKVLQKS